MIINERLRRAPFFRLFCPMAAGIVLQSKAEIPLTALAILSVMALLAAFTVYLFSNHTCRPGVVRMFGLSLNICLLLLGASLSVPVHPAPYKPSLMVATVATAPVISETTCKAILIQVWSLADSTPVPGKVLAYFGNNDRTITPMPGDKLLIFTEMRLIPGPANPYDFNFRTYYSKKKIFYQVFIPSENWRVVDNVMSGNIRLKTELYRYRMTEWIRKFFPRQQENGVLIALYLGNNDYLGYEEKSSFSKAGALHFLAVSGLHTGMVFFMLNFMFRLVPGGGKIRIPRTILIITLLWLYAFLTGLTASVTRACLMLSLWMLAGLIRRESLSFNILFSSAVIILIFNPGMLFDAGFQLSYLAVAGILLFYPHASRAINKTGWLTSRVLTLAIITLAAQLATLPLSLYYFHQMSHYFIITNLLLTSLIAILLYAAPLLLVSGFITCTTLTVTSITGFITRCILRIIDMINQLPGSYSDGYHPDSYQLVLLYILICAAYLYLFMKRKKSILVILAAVLMYLVIDVRHEIICHRQVRIYVYHMHGTGAINIISGKENILLLDKKLTGIYEWQALQNFWDKLGTGPPCILTESFKGSRFSDDCYIWNDPDQINGLTFMQIRKVKIGIAGRIYAMPGVINHIPSIDYLVVQHNCLTELTELGKILPSVTIVFDGTNSPAWVRKTMDECRRLGIKAHNTSENGYFLLNIPTPDGS